MSYKNSSRTKSSSGVDAASGIIFLIAAFIAIIVAVFAFIEVRNFTLGWNVTSLNSQPALPPAGAQSPAASAGQPGSTLAPLLTAVPTQNGPDVQPWDGASRVNILVMGLDYRDYLNHDIPRSDSMIVFTIDPVNKTAGMLSLQRDLWVDIPGFDYGKINTAYFLGEAYKMPGGGPALAVKTVEQFLGIPINYYAQIDFDAFTKFIDDLGGLDIYIHQKITVDPIGSKITLKPGVQTLSGAVALAYARNRYTALDDFDRANRQQEVIMAIRDQVVNLHMLPTLIAQSPKLYNDLSSGIHTDLTLDQIMQLAVLAQNIPPQNIKRELIWYQQVINGKSPDGLDVMIPIPDKIRVLRDEMFTTSGPLSPAAQASDALTLVKQENAAIRIENASGTPGLETRTGDLLKGQGLNVVSEQSNPGQIVSGSQILIYSGKPYTIKYLAALLKLTSSSIINHFDPTDSSNDITLVLGRDWARSMP
ncbi:MAG: LCP family protein [Anaerolineaceae bacterium]|nr:LCP family protein [Anaerolineaceae bacterium]